MSYKEDLEAVKQLIDEGLADVESLEGEALRGAAAYGILLGLQKSVEVKLKYADLRETNEQLQAAA